MNWEMMVAWAIAGVMIVVALVFGTNIWIGSPVVVDGVLRVGILVTHLIGSAVVAGICGLYIWFLVKEY